VRKAIEALIGEGLLLRSHGRGTFVASPPVDQPLAERLVTHSEALLAQGISFVTQVLDARIIPAPSTVAAHLDCNPGEPLFFLRRTRAVEGMFITLLHNYVIAGHCPGIEEIDFTRLRLFEVLEGRYNLTLERGRRIFQAINADEEMADLLDMTPGAAVMHLAQTTYLPDGAAVEYSDVWLRGSSFRLSATMLRGEPAAMDLMLLTKT
jgi:GntR family transcriptional regulator